MRDPVFTLVLVAPKDFENVKAELVAKQPEENQSRLVEAFKVLSHSDIRPNLEAFNVKLVQPIA